jgi:hypothetical protein
MYEKRTNKDLVHTLALQIHACVWGTRVVFQRHVQRFRAERKERGTPLGRATLLICHRMSKWLDPTVKVLYALSAIPSGGGWL